MSKTSEARQVTRLTKNMLTGIEYMVAHPGARYQDIADACEVHIMSVQRWANSPLFIEEFRKRVNEKWGEAIATAQLQLVERVNNDDWKAIEYILDSAGYNETQKVEVKSDTITVNVTGKE